MSISEESGLNAARDQAVESSTKAPEQVVFHIKLHEVVQEEVGIRFVSLCSVDGRSISFMGEQFKGQAQRISAISSSLLGLSEAFTKESGLGGTMHAAVAADVGTVITVRVPSRSRTYVLSVCADSSINMAIALRYALDTSTKVAHVIDRGP